MSVADTQSNGEIPIDAELESILLKPFTESTSKYAFRGWKSLAYLHSLDDIVYHDFKRVFQFQDFDKKFKYLQANEKALMERMELVKQVPIKTLRAKYAPKVSLSSTSRRKHVSKSGGKYRHSSKSKSSAAASRSSSSSSSCTLDGKPHHYHHHQQRQRQQDPPAYEAMMQPHPHLQYVPAGHEHPAYYPPQYAQGMMPMEIMEPMLVESMEPMYPPQAMAYAHFDQMAGHVSYYSPYPYPYPYPQPQPQPQYDVNDGCYYVCAPLPPPADIEERAQSQHSSTFKRKAKSRESRRPVSPPIALASKAEYGDIVGIVDGRSQSSSQDNISSISVANDNFSSTSLSSVVDNV